MTEPRLPGVSVREAAIQLGTSESDIRRRIKRGELQAESFERPGGTLLRVLLPAPPDTLPIESVPTPDTLQEIASGLLALLSERDATIAQKDATILSQAARIAALEREAGAATTRATMEHEARLAAEAELKRLREKLERPWWRFWW